VTRSRRSTDRQGLRVAAVLAGVTAVLYLARATFIPLVFAITLALILSPAVGSLQKLRIRRIPGTLIMMTIALTVMAGIGYVIFNQLVAIVTDLPSYTETIRRKIEAFQSPPQSTLGRVAQSVSDLKKELESTDTPPATPALPAGPVSVRVVNTPASPIDSIRALIAPFLSPFATLGIVLVFTAFLLVEEADLRNRIFRLVGLNRLNATTLAMEDATRRVSRYLLLQFLVNGAFGIVCSFGLYFIGVPYAALWGAVAALLRIVPYVGAAVAGLLPLLLSLAVFDSWAPPLFVFLLFFTVELVTANFVEPVLYGAHTGISSLALLLATIFWATLWGPAGLILSTPLTVCVVVLGRHVPHLSFLHILLGDQQVLERDAQLYQRLLAMDDFDSRALVLEYRADHSLTELYDAVIVPALVRAESDRHKGALDAEREEFMFMNIRDMLAEFGDADSAAPGSSPGRVLCFPANDEADEIAAVMLAQLLEQAGRATVSLPIGPSIDDMLGVVAPGPDDVICVSSIPPLAFTHARNLNRRLRSRFPKTKILIGVWGFSGDVERALQRFRPLPPDHLATNLSGALEYLGIPAPATESNSKDSNSKDEAIAQLTSPEKANTKPRAA
jgi:predicted PurR-regulated permease PerM